MKKIILTAFIAIAALAPSLANAQVYRLNQIASSTPGYYGVLTGDGVGTHAAVATTGPTVGFITATGTATSTINKASITGAISILGEYITNFTSYVRSLFTEGTAIDISSGSISVEPDAIGDTQLTFNTGQHLTTGSSPTFTGLTLSGNLSMTNSAAVISNTTNAGTLTIETKDIGVGSGAAGSISITGGNTDSGGWSAGSINITAGETLSSAGATAGSVNIAGGAQGNAAGPGGNVNISGGAPNGVITFSTNGAERARFIKAGYFGIGTTSPYAPLSVVGETVSSYFTATTSSTSTLPHLTGSFISGFGLSSCTGSSNKLTWAAGTFRCETDQTGGGGAQTPWTGNIDGAGYNLTNAGSLTFTKFTATSTATSTMAGALHLTANQNVGGNNPDEGLLSLNMGTRIGSAWNIQASSSAAAGDGELAHIEQFDASHANEILKIENASTQGGSEEISIHSPVPDIQICDTTDGASTVDCIELEVTHRGEFLINSRKGDNSSYERGFQFSAYRTGGMFALGAQFDADFLTSKMTIVGTSTFDYFDVNGVGNTTSGGEIFTIASTGNVGIGTTTPYGKLSVVGQAVAEYFTSTSTTATSTLPNLSLSRMLFGSDYLTDLTGSGLQITSNALTLDRTGDWTGTFDGMNSPHYEDYTATVCSSGCDYSSIDTAVDSVAASSTILIKNGTYALGAGTITVDGGKTLEIIGESKDGVIITYSGGGAAFTIGSSATTTRHFRMENISIQGSSNGTRGFSFVNVRNSTFSNLRSTGFSSTANPGQAFRLDGSGGYTGDNYFYNLQCDNSDICLNLSGTAVNSNHFYGYNLRANKTTGFAISLANSNGNSFHGGLVGNSLIAIRFLGSADENQVFGTYCEDNITCVDFASGSADNDVKVIDVETNTTLFTDAGTENNFSATGDNGKTNFGSGTFSIGTSSPAFSYFSVARPDSSGNIAGFYNSLGRRVMEIGHVRTNINGSSAFPTAEGMLHLTHNFSDAFNPLSDLNDADDYPLVLQNLNTSTGSTTGIGFSVTNTTDNLGAAIIFERTSTNSMGKLGFYTKQNTTGGADPSLVLSLTDAGVAAFTNNITVGGSASSTFAGGIHASAGGLRIASLASCDTIDTTSEGYFICGSDNAGSGSGGGLGTTTPWSAGQLGMVVNNSTLTGVSTSSVTISSPLSSSGTAGAVVGGSGWTIGITADAIGDTQLAFNTGQHLTTTADVTHNKITTAYSSSTAYSSFVIASTTDLIINGETFRDLTGGGLTISSNALTVNDVTAAMLNAEDFGSFTCNGTNCTVDNGAISNAMLANSTISGIALGSNLANLTATDGTLTFSGTYNGSTARTIGLNLGNANTWTALQTFGSASTTGMHTFGHASSTQWSGGGLASDCDADNQTLGWDATTKMFTCGDDDTGGAGSQTPWTSAIDGGGFALTNAGAITMTSFTATSTTATSSANIFSVGSTTPSATALFQVGTSSPLFHVNKTNGKLGFLGINTSPAMISFGEGSNPNINPNIKLLSQDATDARIGACVSDVCMVFKNDGGLFRYNYLTATPQNINFQEFGGSVGIASTTPTKLLSVQGEAWMSATTTTYGLNVRSSLTGTSTQYIHSGTSGFGGEIILEDTDGAGCTSIASLDGSLITKTVTCPAEI